MIFLVRHGEAAASWGDHPDPGLSALGHKQAEAVAERLVELGASGLVSSPMQRCQETAAPLAARLNQAPRLEPDVSEITTPAHVEDRVLWLKTLMAGQWPDDMLHFCNNSEKSVEKLTEGTAVFSHFVAINAIVGRLTGNRDVLVFRPGHCSITVLDRDPGTGKLQVMRLGNEAATRIL